MAILRNSFKIMRRVFRKSSIIKFYFILKSTKSISTAMRIALNSLKQYYLEHLQVFSIWEPSNLVVESRELERVTDNHVLTIHIFYEEFLDILIEAKNWDLYDKVFITTPSELIYKRMKKEFASITNLECIKVPNIGRNLSHIFVTLQKEVVKYRFITHIHSKKSPHLVEAAAQKWQKGLWDALFLDQQIVARALQILNSDERAGIYYPLLTDQRNFWIFNWSSNEKEATKLVNRIGLDHVVDPFEFPAGGMFISKVDAIKPLLMANLDYRDFPEEKGQVDGTLQHALERLIGTIPTTLGYSHLKYLPELNEFTFDNSYLNQVIKGS